MKKIYSFLLMATALLISTNMKAVDVASVTIDGTTTNYTTIAEAMSNARPAGGTATLTLLEDISDAAYYGISNGCNLTIDLAGHTWHSTSALFRLSHGTLTIKTSVLGGNMTSSNQGIIVIGHSEDVANYSVLNIQEGVTITCPYAVVNLNYDSGDNSTKKAYGVKINIDGTVVTTGDLWMTLNINGTLQNTTGTNLPEFNIGANAVIEQSNTSIYNDAYSEFSGTTTTNVTQQNQVVEIWNTLKGGSYTSYSELESAPYVYQESNTVIYAAGYAIWNIKGEIKGGNGIYMKSGALNLSGDAKVTATASEYWPPVYFGSGFYACGVAFVIDNNAGYANKLSVNIKDNVEITAATGPAILEATTLAGDDKLLTDDAIVIEGGTFTGGSEAPTIILEAEVAQNVVENGTITGGNWSDNSVLEYVNESNLLVAELTEDGETSFTLTKPAEGTTISAGADLAGVTASETTNVKLSGDADEEINTDLTVAYLEVTGAKTLTIKSGATLSAGSIVLGADAQIIVEAGATLKVTGSTGIVAFNSSNIVVEASATERGIVLITPLATSNTHPYATVEYTSSSYKKTDGSVVFQYFGHPMYNGAVTSVSLTDGVGGYLNGWNGTSYDEIGFLNIASTPQANDNLAYFNNTFGFYALQTNNAEGVKPILTFKGQVNGNNDKELTLLNQWTTASNGYLGNIDKDAILAAVTTWGATPYVYQYFIDENGDLKWKAKGATLSPLSDIAPMEPMMFFNSGLKNVTLDYSALVWNPATGESVAAPARATDFTMAAINVKGEGCEDEVIVAQSNEEGAPKYLSGKLNLYVFAEEKMDIYTADDLNNTLIGYQVAKAGVYTMTFHNVQGNALTLVDLANNTQINIEEGATYTFAASANEVNDARFQVVEARKMPTAVETIETVKAQKGIYNMVGKYLGENFDVLPAGVYVVNGVKVVK